MSDTLTAKGAATRRRIVEGAAEEIREHGVSTTTLDDIRARTLTSKGQLFHYFPGGREELLLVRRPARSRPRARRSTTALGTTHQLAGVAGVA